MAATQQSQAIQNANTIIALAGQFLTLNYAIAQISNAWADDGTATVLNAMGTTALGADGTAGAADGSPNVAHPLDLSKYPALSRAISANQIASLLTELQTVTTLVAGSAVSAQPGMRGILNAAVGG